MKESTTIPRLLKPRVVMPASETMPIVSEPPAARSRSESLEGLAQEINAEHGLLEAAGCEVLGHARKAGERLLRVKALVGHGKFEEWVRANCTCSYRTARSYMFVAKHWTEIEAQNGSALPLSLRETLRLLRAASQPKEHRRREKSKRPVIPGYAA